MAGLAPAGFALPLRQDSEAEDPALQYWEATFESVLPQFRRAAEGQDEISPERLIWLYRNLLYFHSEYPARWPDELELGRTLESMQAYRRAASLPGDEWALCDYQTTGNYEAAGRSAEARDHLQLVVDTYAPGTPYLAELHLVLASYARQCREWQAAQEHVQAAEGSLVLEQNPARARAVQVAGIDVLLERCAGWIGVGANERALAELRRARAEARELGDSQVMGSVVLEELNLAVAVDAHRQLHRILDEARASAWYSEVPAWLVAQHDLRVAVGRAEHERQDPELPAEAIALLQEVVSRPELPDEDRLIGELRLAELWTEAGDLDRADGLLQSCRGRAARASTPCAGTFSDRRAVDVALLAARLELARGASSQRLRAVLVELRQTFESMLASWRLAPASDAGLGLMHTRDRLGIGEVLVSLVLGVEGADGAARALEEVGRVQAAGSLARALGARAPSSEEILEDLLPSAGGLLVLLPGAARSYVFCVDRELGVSAHPVPSVYRLDPLRRALGEELSLSLREHRFGPRVESIVAELSRGLLPREVQERIRSWSELAVVGIDGLGYVPFELLRGFDGERLGDRLPVRYLPSLPVGLCLAQRARQREPARPSIELFAGPDAQLAREGSPVLEFGQAELDGLSRGTAFRWSPTLSSAATLGALRGLKSDRSFALHLIAHGAPTGDSSRPAGLLLHGEPGARVLTPSLAEAMDVPRLVLLTACSTWSGPLRRGDDGRHHLAGSLMLAGADNVLLSTLEVEYRAQLALLESFYRALSEGEEPARALHTARRARAHDPSPGRYLVHALGPPIVVPRVPEAGARADSSVSPRPWLVGLGLVLLTAAAWITRRKLWPGRTA